MMPPDANWPNIPDYRNITPADHAAHTTPKGTLRPDEIYLNAKPSHKMAKELMKIGHKPHLKLKTAKPQPRRRSPAARRKKRN